MKKLIILMLTDRKKLSAAVGIMVIIVMLINCFAVAESRHDTKWYYQTQFNEVAEIALAPSIESLKAPQRFAQQEDVVVDIDVIEVGWIENSKFLLSALINCCEPDRVELHPESFLDLDGGYIGPNSDAVPGKGEHTEHYLWTSDGYGPVKEQVDDPSKQLILFDVKGIMINGMECLCESDFIRLDDGRLFLYAECDLAWVSNVNAVGDAKQAQARLAADPDTAIATLIYTTIIYEEGNDASLYANHESKLVEMLVETE